MILVNAYIDAMRNPYDAVRKFIQVLNDPECQTSCTSPESVNDRYLPINFSYNDVDVALQKLKDSHG